MKTLIAFAAALLYLSAAHAAKKPNILFIIGDDMRMQHGCYGFDQMKTPNLDQLAEAGCTFTRAYVQQEICAPSRASFLTGCRPDTTGVNFPYSQWSNLLADRNAWQHCLPEGVVSLANNPHGNDEVYFDPDGSVPFKKEPKFFSPK